MNASRRHSNGDGGFGRSAGDAAFRGAMLIGVAVIIGLLLLWRAHDDSSASVSTDGDTPAATNSTTTTTKAGTGTGSTGATGGSGSTGAPGTTAVPTVHPTNQVKVLVANGTGTQNGASLVTAKLTPKGYATLSAANATSNQTAASRIYYRPGYAEDAKQIARDLGVADPVEPLLEAMPETPPVSGAPAAQRAKDAHVLVVIGLDQKIKQA
jgi:hypothetical protein